MSDVAFDEPLACLAEAFGAGDGSTDALLVVPSCDEREASVTSLAIAAAATMQGEPRALTI